MHELRENARREADGYSYVHDVPGTPVRSSRRRCPVHGAPNAQAPVDNTASKQEQLVTLWTDIQASSMSVKVGTLTPSTSLREGRP